MLKIMICDELDRERDQIIQDVRRWCDERSQPALIEFCRGWPELADKLKQGGYDLVIVSQEGVKGLDLITSARPLLDRIIWFSDLDFALQAYRLCVSYFAMTPVTGLKVERALDRCREDGR